MKNILKNLKNELTQSLFESNDFKNKKLYAFLVACSFIFYFLAFLSIPIFSFKISLNKITWLFTILFLISMFFVLIFYSGIVINPITISLVCFIFIVIISSLINGFKQFTFTPIALSVTTMVIYMFLYKNKTFQRCFLLLSYISLWIFALVFLAIYSKEILSFDFYRLGSYFGDINDIAIFLGLGFALSIISIFKTRKWLDLCILILGLALFSLCGLSTGSKVFILLVVASTILSLLLLLKEKKAKWYVYIIVFALLFLIGYGIISLPMFKTIKLRLKEFFEDQSTFLRLDMAIDGVIMFLRKPLLGYGNHGFFISSSYGGMWSHNNFSEILASYGLLGFVAFYVPYYYSMKNVETKNLYTCILLCINITFICCMFTVAMESQKVFAYFIPVFYSSASMNSKKVFLRRNKIQLISLEND